MKDFDPTKFTTNTHLIVKLSKYSKYVTEYPPPYLPVGYPSEKVPSQAHRAPLFRHMMEKERPLC
jgi:hypothetical protein